MHWAWNRIKGAINSGIEGLIWLAVVGVTLLVWQRRGADVTLPAWALVLLVGAAVGLLLTLVSRRLTRRGWFGRVAELEDEFELGAYYSRHLYDTLESLQKVLMGTIPSVTTDTFIEQGMLQPAREFLKKRPDEEIRVSVLMPDDGSWRMPFAAGYSLESRQRFSLPIVGSFSRHAFESGETQWSLDLENDLRYTPHPLAEHAYRSIISVPILTGDVPIGVLNVDSPSKNAFSSADLVYVTLLGAIVSVVLALARRPGEIGR